MGVWARFMGSRNGVSVRGFLVAERPFEGCRGFQPPEKVRSERTLVAERRPKAPTSTPHPGAPSRTSLRDGEGREGETGA